jgi:hypothetical protein
MLSDPLYFIEGSKKRTPPPPILYPHQSYFSCEYKIKEPQNNSFGGNLSAEETKQQERRENNAGLVMSVWLTV